jgi:MYXO-CTERM domain-containing protein
MRALFVPALTLACSLSAGQALAQTRVVYLWYADGGPVPVPVNTSCAGTPPPYTCDFAPTPVACKRAVQRYLDAWYADLDLVFTLSKPAGDYDTVVITRDGTWCGVTSQNLGRGMLAPMCQNLPTGYALVYQCATDAKRCATIIAQEQAHLVGLEHTVSERDVMNENFLTTHEGFEDALNAVVHPPVCQREQNSYQKMKERVGAWMGGAKPLPFDPEVDAGGDGPPPSEDAGTVDAEPEAPGPDAGAGGSGGDAPARDAAAADAAAVGGDDGGCGCDVGGQPQAARWPLAAAMALLVLRRRRRRRRGPGPSKRSKMAA